jgi:hypothetical protein
MSFGVPRTYIPSKKYKNGPDRNLSNKSLESLFCLALRVLQRLFADLKQIFSSLHRCCHFLCRVCNRSSHLLREFFCQYILLTPQKVQCFFHNRLSVCQSCLPEAEESFCCHLREELEISRRNAISGQDWLVRDRGDGRNRFDRHFACSRVNCSRTLKMSKKVG